MIGDGAGNGAGGCRTSSKHWWQAMTCQQCCRGEDSGAIELESYGGQRTSVPTIRDFDCGLVGTALQRLCPPC